MIEARRITSIEPAPKSSMPFWVHRGFRSVGVGHQGYDTRRMDLPGATTAVDISGLDKRVLLEALVAKKRTHSVDVDMNGDVPFDVDYFKGCAVKTNLVFDLADPTKYNQLRYHGAGAFEAVVQELCAAIVARGAPVV